MARRRRRAFRTLQQSCDAPQAGGDAPSCNYRETAPGGGRGGFSRRSRVAAAAIARVVMPLPESTLVLASPSPPLPPPFAVAIVAYLRLVASERVRGKKGSGAGSAATASFGSPGGSLRPGDGQS